MPSSAPTASTWRGTPLNGDLPACAGACCGARSPRLSDPRPGRGTPGPGLDWLFPTRTDRGSPPGAGAAGGGEERQYRRRAPTARLRGLARADPQRVVVRGPRRRCSAATCRPRSRRRLARQAMIVATTPPIRAAPSAGSGRLPGPGDAAIPRGADRRRETDLSHAFEACCRFRRRQLRALVLESDRGTRRRTALAGRSIAGWPADRVDPEALLARRTWPRWPRRRLVVLPGD